MEDHINNMKYFSDSKKLFVKVMKQLINYKNLSIDTDNGH